VRRHPAQAPGQRARRRHRPAGEPWGNPKVRQG
jgi:hypothetical protein